MKAYFVRKACKIEQLKEKHGAGNGSQHVVEEVVELEPGEYSNFANNLLDDFDFISRQKDKMYVDSDKVWHCILVKSKGGSDGVLIESEGYDYARYAAYLTEEELSGYKV